VHRFGAKWDVGEDRGLVVRGASEALVLAAIGLTLGFGMNATTPVPDQIAQELGKTPKGKATVIDFVDFECPFCRMTHEELTPVMAKHKDQLRVVRKQVPLTRIHPHAMTAAIAACCSEQLGQGDAMAEALFATPAEDLTPAKCEELAEKLGLPLDAFRTCVADPKTQDRIKEDTAMFRSTGGLGLPTLWIDRTKLEGAQPTETLEQTVDQALAKAGS
jgi:protein-disulfide isomerase